MGRLLRRVLLLLVVASRLQASTETERLVAVGKLWGQVKFFHPWLRYKPIDWDAALVAELPRIRSAATDDEFAAAVGALLFRLGDPLTCVEKAPPAPASQGAAAGAVTPWYRWEGKVLVVTLSSLPAAMEKDGYGFGQSLKSELAGAEAVLVDARLGGANRDGVEWGFGSIAAMLVPRAVSEPARRAVLLNGYPPQMGGTSGGYYQGFVVTPGQVYTPDAEAPQRRVVFLVDPGWVPGVAEALAAAGAGAIVATGPLHDTAQAVNVTLPGGWRSALRVSETLGAPPKADVEIGAGEDPLAAALARAVEPARPQTRAANEVASETGAPEWHPDSRYEGMAYPSAEYRLLAVYRLWNVIHYFYPYLGLLDDWDPVLGEFVSRALGAADGKAYALTMLEMAARVTDGHTYVWGNPAIDEVMGAAGAPVEVRIIEDHPTVVRILDARAAVGLRLGDVIESVEGELAEAKMSRLAPYVSASTPEAKRARLGRMLLRGADGAALKAIVRGADGYPRPVTLTLSTKPPRPAEAPPPAYRALSPEIGYADLTRLVPSEVDRMFEALKDTKGLILDMRGYPNGTAWSIAPHINVKKAKIGARFRRPLWSGFDLVDEDVSGGTSFAFEQPLPTSTGELYKGRTVMLIDERAISQSEHSGLFFEAAADTVFIGTPSAGANGDVTRLTLPGGIAVGFTGHDVRHADGRQLQRVGLQPQIRVAPTLAGIRAGKDEVLDRAIEFLKIVR